MTESSGEPLPELPTGITDSQVTAHPDRRRWRWRLCLALVLIVIGGGLAVWKGPVLGLLGIDEQGPEVYALVYVGIIERTERDYDTYRRSQAQLVKSRRVLNAVLRQPEVAELDIVKQQEDPASWLEENLQVDFLDNRDFLRIGMSNGDLKDMQILVEAVTRIYLQESDDRDRAQIYERLSTSKDEFEQRRKTLKEWLEYFKSTDPGNAALMQQALPPLRAGCKQMESANGPSDLQVEIEWVERHLQDIQREMELLEQAPPLAVLLEVKVAKSK